MTASITVPLGIDPKQAHCGECVMLNESKQPMDTTAAGDNLYGHGCLAGHDVQGLHPANIIRPQACHDAVAARERGLAEIEWLKKENDAAHTYNVAGILRMIKGVTITGAEGDENGVIELSTDMLQFVGDIVRIVMAHNKAPNFVISTLQSCDDPTMADFTITVQRNTGLTPEEKYLKLLAKAREARQEIADLIEGFIYRKDDMIDHQHSADALNFLRRIGLKDDPRIFPAVTYDAAVYKWIEDGDRE